jgi:hypothetical protein
MIAMDRYSTEIDLGPSSARRWDQNGYLHVRCHITKACVSPYQGKEIPNHEKLGLDANKIYMLLRDPGELAKAARHFDNMPLLNEHKPQSSDAPSKNKRVGSLGTDTAFNYPYLDNTLVIWDGADQAGVETGQKRELSSSYWYDPVMVPGEFEGTKYDGIMTNIRANHVALVERGRVGSDVLVADSIEGMDFMPAQKRPSRKAVLVSGALTGYLLPKLAQDAKLDLKPIVSGVTAADWPKQKAVIADAIKAGKAGKLAEDANLDDLPKFLGALDEDDMGEDAKEDDDDDEDDDDKKKAAKAAKDKAAKDAAEKAAKDKADKAAADAAAEDGDKVSKQAMDAAIAEAVTKAVAKAKSETETATVARMQAIQQAERDCRPLIGEIAVAQDSAEGVYRLTLETAGGYEAAELAGVPLSGLAAMVKRLPKPGEVEPLQQRRLAQDAAPSLAKKFPALGRIGNQG